MIEEHWKSFLSRIISDDAPDIQKAEMKKAFYAGYAMAFGDVSSISNLPLDQGFKKLDSISLEIFTYMESLRG